VPVALLVALCLLLAMATPATAAAPTDTDWLGWLNLYRAQAGLAPVSENTSMSVAALTHSQWIVDTNTFSHPECTEPEFLPTTCTPLAAGATIAGHQAGMNGNIAGFTNQRTSRAFLESWISGPFHSTGMLNPGLTSTGYGRAVNTAAPGGALESAATLNVLQGAGAVPAGTVLPIGWPGNGSVTSIATYDGFEQPNPLTPCAGYTAPTGLPIIVRYGSNANIVATASSLVEIDADGFTLDTLDVCHYGATQYSTTPGNAGAAVLRQHASVVLIPRQPLVVGKRYRYAVTATVPGAGIRTFDATFRVGSVADSAAPGPGPFSDVTSFHSFAEEIVWMKDTGLAAGTAGAFKPTQAVSRQAMASFLWKLEGSPIVACPIEFGDVPVEHVFRNAICWMAAEGLTTGFAGTPPTFKPTNAVSRQAAASFLFRLDGSPTTAYPNPGFGDVGANHTFLKDISWMVTEGVGGGFTDGTFKPSSAVSRQAVASFLFRFTHRAP